MHIKAINNFLRESKFKKHVKSAGLLIFNRAKVIAQYKIYIILYCGHSANESDPFVPRLIWHYNHIP